MNPKLSLIIPIYNAEKFIIKSLEQISQWINDVKFEVEVIIVNDGSSDDSEFIVAKYIKNYNLNLTFISYRNNKGKGYAVKQGMIRAKGDFRIFTDADIPYGFAVMDEMIYYLDFKEFDVCIGNRRSIHSIYFAKVTFIRKLSSFVFTGIVSRFVVTGIKDTQCGLKGFRGEVANRLFNISVVNGFGFDIEVLYLCYKNEFDIKRIPVTFGGNDESTISLVKDSIRMLKDVLALPFRYHLTNKYK